MCKVYLVSHDLSNWSLQCSSMISEAVVDLLLLFQRAWHFADDERESCMYTGLAFAAWMSIVATC